MKDIFTERPLILSPNLRQLSLVEIQAKVESRRMPVSVLISNLQYDFNLGSIIRSANAFGAKEIFYYGSKKWDRRGAVGTHNYIRVSHLSTREDVQQLKKSYILLALENNLSNPQSIYDYRWSGELPLCIMIGEEGCGLSSHLLDLADHIVEIPQVGTVTSLNAGAAAAVALSYFRCNFDRA